eukprot:6252953-Pyramimonas_sp.AAC.1
MHAPPGLPPQPNVRLLYHSDVRVGALDHLFELGDVPDFDQLLSETLRIPSQYSQGFSRAMLSVRLVPPSWRGDLLTPLCRFRLLPLCGSSRFCRVPFAHLFDPTCPLCNEPMFAGPRPLAATCAVTRSATPLSVARRPRTCHRLFPSITDVRGAFTSPLCPYHFAEPLSYLVAILLVQPPLCMTSRGDLCYSSRCAPVHLVPEVGLGYVGT